ncbi:hypothetical protein [Pectobacterium aroidearum]|uniref:hypothetical protein n=1 Tax=Pectobacterium aroidearum TaxID=1201031 RepID=UPI002115931D|nr:hypothetical protein [Pectobacterium aroidearum]UUE56989.1 hypothetical protein L0Y27_17705 [Pectobacterium aroidearum]UUE69695.1 hypothetical protein L0Y21_18595 [Pectobacterium aroidearum]UUE74068.1 hypothetical protein L0Y20_18695 [Pectobacterium aroidearum]UUE78401.1 hypothetical protein L0Y24_18135 [Pectobacterium aroidearum]
MMNRKAKIFNRYTDLTALIDISSKKLIFLLDPTFWDDKNDVFFISKYKEKNRLTTFLALCFIKKYEAYHHWSVFASGGSGVCIRFKRYGLIHFLGGFSSVKFKEIKYKEITEVRNYGFSLNESLFLKIMSYKDEQEFFAIYESGNIEKIKEVPLCLSINYRIVLSTWLPDALIDTIKKTIKWINGCEKIKAHKTTLPSNVNWLSAVDKLV